LGEITPLGIDGAWLYQSSVFSDSRGYFTEWFKDELISKSIPQGLDVAQANLSKSKKGVVRGIHFSIAQAGQAKWITCASGKIWDVVVDIRPKSPTFKKWIAIELNEASGKSVFIQEGLGHAFLAMEDETIISYLLSSPYSPNEELAINPKDPQIAINWPLDDLLFSPKDEYAPNLEDLLETLKQSPHTGSN
jgi:dTDP-4-dehydrorhamnose 3,5-epimerase